jgi:hypothetical protein
MAQRVRVHVGQFGAAQQRLEGAADEVTLAQRIALAVREDERAIVTVGTPGAMPSSQRAQSQFGKFLRAPGGFSLERSERKPTGDILR